MIQILTVNSQGRRSRGLVYISKLFSLNFLKYEGKVMILLTELQRVYWNRRSIQHMSCEFRSDSHCSVG